MYLTKNDRAKLKAYVIDTMLNRTSIIASKFEDDEYENEFRILIDHKAYAQAFYMCCTFGCVRYEVEFINNIMLKCALNEVLTVNEYHIAQPNDPDSLIWVEAIRGFDQACEQLTSLIFNEGE